jgi:hypothetical protein
MRVMGKGNHLSLQGEVARGDSPERVRVLRAVRAVVPLPQPSPWKERGF